MDIDKEQLIILTKDILANMERVPDRDISSIENKVQENIGYKFIGRGNGHNFLFKGDTYKDLHECIQMIKGDLEFKNVSLEKIKTEYTNITIELSENGEASDKDIKKEIDSLLDILIDSVEGITVVIPIQYLELKDLSEISIGKVHLIPFNSIKDDLRIQPLMIPEGFIDKVCGMVKVKSERGKAYTIALSEVDRVVNLLRLYIPLLFHKESEIKLVAGENALPNSISFVSTTSAGELEFAEKYLGPFGRYNLSEERLQYLKTNCCFEEIDNILSEDLPQTELKIAITLAIRWLGMGIHEDIPCDKFLNYTIALESLILNKNDRRSKTSKITERTAYIIWGASATSEDKKIVSDLYDLRGKIVHEGLVEIDDEMLENMRIIATTCLFYMSSKAETWNDADGLRKEIEEAKSSRMHNLEILPPSSFWS